MAQSGYTPIQLYHSTTPGNVPLDVNLAAGELAINIADGKIYYKDDAGVVQEITVSKLISSNFTVEESGGKLIFKYGGTTIASMSSAGVFTALSDITSNDTP
jgi:hypothetical protein